MKYRQALRLAHMLDAHRRGLPLLPIEPASQGGKEPNHHVLKEVYGTTKWSELAKRPASRVEIQAWVEVDPDTNFGLICGPASTVVVLDVDDPGKTPVFQHPPVPTSQTARGHHMFFSGRGRGTSYPWGSIQGEGQYVVLPPSVHSSGFERNWLIGLDDAHLEPIDDLRIGGRRYAPWTPPYP